MKWDVFHVKNFEQVFGVEESEVRRMIAAGELSGNDCLRRTGDEQWIRLSTLPEFSSPPPGAKEDTDRAAPVHRVSFRPAADKPPARRKQTEPPVPEPEQKEVPQPINLGEPLPASVESLANKLAEDEWDDSDPEDWDQEERSAVVAPDVPPSAPPVSEVQRVRTPVIDPEEGDEEEFSFRNRIRTEVEELDLTAMVDVSFLLVLFFMITATYTLQQSINVPAPDPEQKKAQQAIQSLDDLREDYIVVTINADNTLDVDGEPVRADFKSLVERIRRINRESSRNELVIYANPAAFHETVVLVYDAANEVGMQRVRLAVDSEG